MYRRRMMLAVLACALPLVSGFASSSQVSVHTMKSTTVAAEVASLVNRMTLAEKVGQMTQVDISDVWAQNDPSQLDPSALKHVLGDLHVGSILNGGSDNPMPNTPATWAAQSDQIQQFATKNTRLHIPVIYGIDAVHGDGHIPGAAIFPQNLGMASTWDPSLVKQEGAITATDLQAMGVRWDFAPDLDLARDVRWGRYYETFGEDPYLASVLGSAAVSGMQGTNSASLRIAATGKHFVGYSEPLTGQDRTEEQLPLRYLRENFLPPFQSAVSQGLASVMVQSGSVNDVPAHASHYLLTDVLRGQMHFHGIVVSDWADIHNLYASYHVATSDMDAVQIAVNAGVDMAMVPYDADTYTSDLIQLVQEKKVSMARINEAVTDILTVKVNLGLFQNPYADTKKANGVVYGTGFATARQAADESLVLLKNNGVLPLKTNLPSILVAGPSADSVANQMGGWTIGWQGMPDGSTEPGAVTVLHGIQNAVAKGSKVLSYTGDSPASAAAMARKASAAIVVVGEQPYAETAGDTVNDALPPSQSALIRAVEATGKPTVVVVLSGRPLIMTDTINQSNAVLVGFLPGSATGSAVADVVFGQYDPSGRLPVSWPSDIGEEPLFYNQLPAVNGTPPTPLYPFGYGLSYTRFATTNLTATSSVTTTGTIHVKVDVANMGSVAGTDTVQLYETPETSPVLQPVKRLIGFQRVSLRPLERRTVSFDIPSSRMAVVSGDITGTGPMTVEPGTYSLSVDDNSTVVTVR